MNKKIADAHAHIFPENIALDASKGIWDFYQVTSGGIGTAQILLDEGREQGIGKFLVCSVATSPAQVKSINDFLYNEARLHSELVPFGAMHPNFEDFKSELARIKELGLYGIKLHPDMQEFNIDGEELLGIYEECRHLDLPILFHMGDNRFDYSSPERLCAVLRKIPDLKVIASHFGGYMQWQTAYNSFKELFAEGIGKNVYFDTSSTLFTLDRAKARMMITDLGADRFLFGTDFPVWRAEDELRRFLALDLGEEINEKILGQNFEKLFKVMI